MSFIFVLCCISSSKSKFYSYLNLVMITPIASFCSETCTREYLLSYTFGKYIANSYCLRGQSLISKLVIVRTHELLDAFNVISKIQMLFNASAIRVDCKHIKVCKKMKISKSTNELLSTPMPTFPIS